MWDNKEGKIVGLLSGKAKVEIATEGPTQGQVHLYDPKNVTKMAEAQEVGAAAAQKRKGGEDGSPAPASPAKKQATIDQLLSTQAAVETLFDDNELED